ncbi:uncharacterized protein LOC125032893 [Penaeus chinensis]|uniref:uncharacterized protein LOC125032893 n=1 Tax=Penaeus chinensis TaxID=139456 RepID=UPI001FB5A045|nr:uncharacterized protein LOC125032893 [Penaeus chinensis]
MQPPPLRASSGSTDEQQSNKQHEGERRSEVKAEMKPYLLSTVRKVKWIPRFSEARLMKTVLLRPPRLAVNLKYGRAGTPGLLQVQGLPGLFTALEHTLLPNTKYFVTDITILKINEPVVMASVRIQSLFTNVPLEETTNLIVRELLSLSEYPNDLNEKQMPKALQLATVDKLYTQTDGVAMGSPFGPTYASTFLCSQEKEWLKPMP